VIAEVTLFYGWGPRDAMGLTPSELERWLKQAHRLTAGKAHVK
jgi:hypothetical protein